MPNESAGGMRVDEPGQRSSSAERFSAKQREVCEILRTLFPRSLVLVVTRGYRGMVRSAYSQYVRSGGTLDLPGMCRGLAGRLGDEEHHYYDYDHPFPPSVWARGPGRKDVGCG